MSSELSPAQTVKLALFFGGIRISREAEDYITETLGPRPMTLADYASTTGIGLALPDDVWVNAPIATYNPNIVFDPRHELLVHDRQLFIRGVDDRVEIPARFVAVPDYHDQRNGAGELFTEYVHTHTDRARISPVRGCAMRCKFCDIPYEFKGRYYPKPVGRLLEAAQRAFDDKTQPAAHLLISGGTPGPRDIKYLKEVYRTVITTFKGRGVDVMMVPSADIVDLDDLIDAGVDELSLNIEMWDRDLAARIMPEKHAAGRDTYMGFIARAVERMGPGRVRSILMVGLEPAESTLEGVRALSAIGCVPVLSPFRPDPITELANLAPPSVETMTRIFLEARDIAWSYGLKLGPKCIPCSHNTLTLSDGSSDYGYHERRPTLV